MRLIHQASIPNVARLELPAADPLLRLAVTFDVKTCAAEELDPSASVEVLACAIRMKRAVRKWCDIHRKDTRELIAVGVFHGSNINLTVGYVNNPTKINCIRQRLRFSYSSQALCPSPPDKRAFVAAYLKLRDGKAAAIEAGYAPNGAAVQSWRNLRIPEVREALRRADASIVQKVNNVNYVQENANRKLIDNAEVSVGRVLKEASRVAYFDPKDCYGADGRMLAINEMSEDARRAIQGVKLTEFGPEYRVAPKLPALDLISPSSRHGEPASSARRTYFRD